MADQLLAYGTDVDQVRAAAKRAHNLDVEFLNNMDVSKDLILTVSHIQRFHEQAISEFDDFVPKSLFAKHDGPTCIKVLKDGIKTVKPIFTHYEAVYQFMEPGTDTKFKCYDKHRKLENSVNEAISHVERKTGQNLSRDTTFGMVFLIENRLTKSV